MTKLTNFQHNAVIALGAIIITVMSIQTTAETRVEADSTYVDPGVIAKDLCSGDLSGRVSVQNNVNTTVTGSYTVTYQVTDNAGNRAQAERQVTVVDTTAPVITRQGEAVVTVQVGAIYIDAGATAYDAYDGSLNDYIEVASTVNTAHAGVYTVTYRVTDTSGNEALPVSRTVKVVEPASGLMVITPASGSTWYVAESVDTFSMPLTLAADQSLESVVYTIDDIPLAVCEQAPFDTLATLDMAIYGWGTHRIAATAMIAGTKAIVSAESVITLAPAPANMDADANGLPDNPFVALPICGDAWVDAVTAENGELRQIAALRFQAISDAPVTLAAGNALLSAPRALINLQETGILVLAEAPSLEALFGDDAAAQFNAAPKGYAPVNGASFMAINLLISMNGYTTFKQLDPARLAEAPVSMAVTGLAAATVEDQTILAHPTTVQTDVALGFAITPAQGAWSAESLSNPIFGQGAFGVDITQTGAVVTLYAPVME